jgi:hypothetical protein
MLRQIAPCITVFSDAVAGFRSSQNARHQKTEQTLDQGWRNRFDGELCWINPNPRIGSRAGVLIWKKFSESS